MAGNERYSGLPGQTLKRTPQKQGTDPKLLKFKKKVESLGPIDRIGCSRHIKEQLTDEDSVATFARLMMDDDPRIAMKVACCIIDLTMELEPRILLAAKDQLDAAKSRTDTVRTQSRSIAVSYFATRASKTLSLIEALGDDFQNASTSLKSVLIEGILKNGDLKTIALFKLSEATLGKVKSLGKWAERIEDLRQKRTDVAHHEKLLRALNTELRALERLFRV